MRKLMLIGFLMILGIGLGFPGAGYCADKPKVIHVGNAGAFTGDAAAPCMEIFNSSQIAVDEWNAKGGIQGIKIEQIMGDDAMDPAQAVNVAQKFCTDDLMLGVIGPPMSHTAQASLKIYNGCDLVNITTSASKPSLTDQGTKSFFRVNARDDAHGWNVALFIKRNLKPNRIAVLNEKTAYCESIADETIKGLKKLGMKDADIMQDTIVGGAKDFSSVLTKVKAFNPDVLFFVAITAPDNAVAVRQAKELGIKATYFGTEGARDKKDFIQAAEGAAEGAYVYHFAPDVFAIPEAANYIKKFEAKYGTISGFGPPAYEAMNILLTAIDKAAKSNKLTRKEVLKNMAETKNYKGILGFPVSFNNKGDLEGGATYIFRVEGNTFKQIAVMTGK
jgi:branched-chain amino acid transport system substrate-binding protein